MLLSLTIENWMSFYESVTFTMFASKERQHGDRLYSLQKYRKRILPISSLFGGNASGKSNFFKAISFAKNFVVKGVQTDKRIKVEPFLLKEEQKPVKFEFLILVEDNIYSYSFAVFENKIVKESLCKFLTNSEQKQYVRTNQDIEFGREYTDSGFFEFASQATRENQLFLTNSVNLNMKDFKHIYDWFRYTLRLIDPNSFFLFPERLFENEHSGLSNICKMLNDLDTGIQKIDSIKVNIENLGLSKEQIDEIYDELGENETVYLHSIGQNERIYISNKNGKFITQKLATFHKDFNGDLIPFNMNQESDGSLRAIDIIPALLGLMTEVDSSKVLIIDELDRSLHTLLTRKLIETYLKSCGKDTKTQFIFTTHDVQLIDQSLLRRDEMWLVDRNDKGISDLYSFSDFKDYRFDKNIRKDYLVGRMGGIPNLPFILG